MIRADVTLRDGFGDKFALTFWNDAAVSEAAARAEVAREARAFAVAHPEADVRASQLTVLAVVLS